MNLRNKRVLVTGAAGGIGCELADQLLAAGAHVLLSGRNLAALNAAIAQCRVGRERAGAVVADLTKASDRARLAAIASEWHGGIDILVNNAGASDFGLLPDHSLDQIERSITTNLLAPLDLTRLLLPVLRSKSEACVVNVGSVFGSIGFAGHTAYCATKFGLRGFSEALRRELADTNIRVHYFAPRATRTSFNSATVDALNESLGNTIDEPADVARRIRQALEAKRLERIFGWPEKFFARVNAILPRIVDRAVRKQLAIIQQHARVNAVAPSTYSEPRGRKFG